MAEASQAPPNLPNQTEHRNIAQRSWSCCANAGKSQRAVCASANHRLKHPLNGFFENTPPISHGAMAKGRNIFGHGFNRVQ